MSLHEEKKPDDKSAPSQSLFCYIVFVIFVLRTCDPRRSHCECEHVNFLHVPRRKYRILLLEKDSTYANVNITFA